MISRNLLLELKQILEEDYHLELTLQEATEIGSDLLALVETLMKIEAKNNYENKSAIKTN